MVNTCHGCIPLSPECPEELIVCSKDHRAAGSTAVALASDSSLTWLSEEHPLLKRLPPYPKHLIVFNQNPLALLQGSRRLQVVNEGGVLIVPLTLGLSDELHSVFTHTFRTFWGRTGLMRLTFLRDPQDKGALGSSTCPPGIAPSACFRPFLELLAHKQLT